MTERRLETTTNFLLAESIVRSGPAAEALCDPIIDTPMVMTLDQLKPYDLDPRVTRNPRYDEIKASIRHRGLDAPPAITRRPGEPHFRIRNGGNTRLSILNELWSETKDEKFFRILCLFRPWPQRGEIVALTGHLAENELRGGLTFIERALGVEKARELYELECGSTLSQSELSRRLCADGYGPARAKLFMNRPTLSDEQMDDINWIGSKHFRNTSGYYDKYHSKTPRNRWPFNTTRDAGLAQVPSGGGYPTCRQWWSDAGHGLRSRLLLQVDPDLLTRLSKWAGFLSKTEADDAVIRSVVSPRQQTLNQGQVYSSYGGQIDMKASNIAARAASDLGLTVGSTAFFPAMDVVRQALPMVLSFLKMALTICIPLILVIGTYDLKALMTISCIQFALFFVDFWFQLARWIDSTILDALYGWNSPHSNFNVLMGLNNSFGDMLLNFVMATMFLVLPGFWVASLAWAGVRAGSILQSFNDSTKQAGDAGSKGSSLGMKILK